MTCSAARYLLVAGFAGVAVASLTGSDLFGLLAGMAAAVLVAAFERLGPGRGRRSCPVSVPAGRTSGLADPAERERTAG